MIKAEYKKNEAMELKISGDLETIWCETLEILRNFHASISRTTSKAEADSFIDSLAFLSKLSSGEFEGHAGEVLFGKFLAEKNSNN